MDRLELLTAIDRLRDVEARLKAIKDNPLKNYNNGDKVHLKQMEFHRMKKRNKWAFGGNRSGKTECGAVEAVYLATGTHPYITNRPDVEGWVVSLSYEVQRDVAQKKLLKYLSPSDIVDVVMEKGSKGSPENGVIDFLVVKNSFGGTSRIYFKSCDQGREKFQGASLDFVWFDEEPPRDIYEECKMRLLDKRGYLFGTMTPLKGLTFVYDEIYLNKSADPEIGYVEMSWRDNPYLDGAEVERMLSTMDEETLSTRCFGKFKADGALVYPEFEEGVHVIDPFPVPTEWQDKLSIDPGLRNPLSCHFYAVDYDGNVYVVGEHYDKEKDIAYHAEAIRRLADELGWHRDEDGRLFALIDSASSQRTLAATKSVAELFFEKDIAVDTRVDKDVFSGIMRVRDYLRARPPRLFIFRNCPNMIREIKGYRYGGGDSPIKRDDHAMDELRYYIASRPTPPDVPRSHTLLETHKNNMLKRLKITKHNV